MTIREHAFAVVALLGVYSALPGTANAATAPTATAEAQSSALGVNSTQQLVVNPGSTPIHSRIDKNGVECPVPQWALHGGVHDTQYAGLGHRMDTWHVGTSVTIPLPGPLMRTCKQGQKAALRYLQADADVRELEAADKLTKLCMSLRYANVYAEDYADACGGISLMAGQTMAQLEDENDAQAKELVRLRDRNRVLEAQYRNDLRK